MQKSILMLGGSRQQIVAIEHAKALGLRTVLCDYLPDNPGQHVADVFYQESTTDCHRMLEIARDENVSGVLAYASDPAATSAAFVAEGLGLPTNPLSSVRVLSEKHLFREHLKKVGLPCPKAASLTSNASGDEVLHMVDKHKMSYPVVVKPTDSSGSKGITVIDTPDASAFGDAVTHAAEFSRNGTLLVEEFISRTFPRVIGGDVFVVDGEIRFWGLMSCLRDEDLGGLVPVGERNPSGLNPSQTKRVKRVLQDLVSSLDLRFGELNVEVIMGKDDTPYVLELGARAGGNMIPVQLSDVSSIDLVEANVRYAMGDSSLDVSFDGNDEPLMTYVLHGNRNGIFSGVEIDPSIERYLYRRVMYVEEGDLVESFDGANKALGILFLRFDSAEQLETATATIGRLIRARILP